MPNAAPYGMELVESCLMCKMRNESFFCSLPPKTLENPARKGW